MHDIRNNKSVINERRQKLFALLTRGMKDYEIAKELNIDPPTDHFSPPMYNTVNIKIIYTTPYYVVSVLPSSILSLLSVLL